MNYVRTVPPILPTLGALVLCALMPPMWPTFCLGVAGGVILVGGHWQPTYAQGERRRRPELMESPSRSFLMMVAVLCWQGYAAGDGSAFLWLSLAFTVLGSIETGIAIGLTVDVLLEQFGIGWRTER